MYQSLIRQGVSLLCILSTDIWSGHGWETKVFFLLWPLRFFNPETTGEKRDTRKKKHKKQGHSVSDVKHEYPWSFFFIFCLWSSSWRIFFFDQMNISHISKQLSLYWNGSSMEWILYPFPCLHQLCLSGVWSELYLYFSESLNVSGDHAQMFTKVSVQKRSYTRRLFHIYTI